MALVAVSGALFVIARTTGSGWLIVMLAAIAGTLAIAAVLPALGLARTGLVLTAPRDATVGRELEFRIELSGRSAVKLQVEGFGSTWTGAVAPTAGLLAATPRRRGVFDTVTVEVRSAAPLGFVWWTRRFIVGLEPALEVGPHPFDVDAPVPTGEGPAGPEGRRLVAVAVDAVRSTREYVQGDPIKLVHWAATARYGDIMVKELESASSPALSISVDLRGVPEAAEEAASRAAGMANAALRLGVPLILLTCERNGPRSGPVASPREVGRRLARAVPGVPAAAPRDTAVIHVRTIGGP